MLVPTSEKNGSIATMCLFFSPNSVCECNTPGTFFPVMEDVRVFRMSKTLMMHGSL